jgi:hypothetical protein
VLQIANPDDRIPVPTNPMPYVVNTVALLLIAIPPKRTISVARPLIPPNRPHLRTLGILPLRYLMPHLTTINGLPPHLHPLVAPFDKREEPRHTVKEEMKVGNKLALTPA